jgi:hypothetical protein
MGLLVAVGACDSDETTKDGTTTTAGTTSGTTNTGCPAAQR